MKAFKSLGWAFAGAAMLVALAFLSGTLLQKQARANSQEQPVWTKQPLPAKMTVAAANARGRTLFLNSCAHCHGEDARGDEGPDLHDLEISDRRIFNVIKRGIKGEMPSFAKKHSDEEITLLLDYLRSLPLDH